MLQNCSSKEDVEIDNMEKIMYKVSTVMAIGRGMWFGGILTYRTSEGRLLS